MAEDALDEVLSAVRTGTATNSKSTSVAQYLDDLDDWQSSQRPQLKPTTSASYAVAVQRITGRIGQRKLRSLAPLEIEALQSELGENGGRAGKPLSPKSVRNTHVVLRKSLSDAERLGLVARNTAATARPPTVQRVEHQT